jgi:hypothetical protein
MAEDAKFVAPDTVTKESGVSSRLDVRLSPAGKDPGFPGYRRIAPVPSVVAPHDTEE